MKESANTYTRQAKSDDLDDILLTLKDLTEVALGESKKILADRIGRDQVLVIVKDVQIIGFLGWTIREEDGNDTRFIEQVTITPEYRGQGFGSMLLESFLKESFAGRIKYVLADVDDGNTRSRNMFDQISSSRLALIDGVYHYKITPSYYYISKKISLIILSVTAVLSSRTMLLMINDPEGPNLLVVFVMSLVVYLPTLAIYLSSLKRESVIGLPRLLLAILAQIILVTVLFFFLK